MRCRYCPSVCLLPLLLNSDSEQISLWHQWLVSSYQTKTLHRLKIEQSLSLLSRLLQSSTCNRFRVLQALSRQAALSDKMDVFAHVELDCMIYARTRKLVDTSVALPTHKLAR
uniref:SED5-binding protein 2 n=1 Tax=Lygus hesperus TaxID=30085 RepID=A0A0A9YLG8_LYGHE